MGKKAFSVSCFTGEKRIDYPFEFFTVFGACHIAKKLARLAGILSVDVIDWSTGEVVAIFDGME